MIYRSIDDLPDSVKSHLPKHAQDIYKEAFNNAWNEYKEASSRRDDATREATAHRVAWAAVKKLYEKDETTGKWEKRS